MIEVERHDDRIWLKGWIGSRTPDLCKSIGGGAFKKEPYKHWRFPLSMTTCRRMREVFGKQLEIGPALNAWAKVAVREEAALLALKDYTTATFDFHRLADEAPALDAKAHPYQRSGIAFGSTLGTYGLFDQPGLGKTAQTIGAIIERGPGETTLGGPAFHLILAPKIAVETVWPAEVARWAGNDCEAFTLTGTRAQRENTLTAALGAAATHVFVCANIEMVRLKPIAPKSKESVPLWPELHAVSWETVVVDESHRALIRNSVKTESQQRKGILALSARNRVALSGTPMRGKPKQLWGTLNWLRPDIYSAMWTFIGNYFDLESDGYSSFVVGQMKPGGADRMARDIAPLVLRRTKAEVLPELPPKTYAGSYLIPGDEGSPFGVWLTPSPAHFQQYEDFAASGVIEDEGQEIEAIGTLAEYTRKCQLSSARHTIVGGVLMPTCDSIKYEWLLEKIAELGIPDGEGRIVVASQFTRLINVFAAGVKVSGVPCHVLTGETPTAERQRIIEDFQSDDPSARVFFLNTKAGGVAVTLDMADDLVLLDESPVPDDQEQVEDRVHRASRMHNVTIHYLRTLGTQDEEIAWIAAARESVQKYLLDGARGVAYARSLYITQREGHRA